MILPNINKIYVLKQLVEYTAQYGFSILSDELITKIAEDLDEKYDFSYDTIEILQCFLTLIKHDRMVGLEDLLDFYREEFVDKLSDFTFDKLKALISKHMNTEGSEIECDVHGFIYDLIENDLGSYELLTIVYSDDAIKDLKKHIENTTLYKHEDHKAVIDRIFNKDGGKTMDNINKIDVLKQLITYTAEYYYRLDDQLKTQIAEELHAENDYDYGTIEILQCFLTLTQYDGTVGIEDLLEFYRENFQDQLGNLIVKKLEVIIAKHMNIKTSEIECDVDSFIYELVDNDLGSHHLLRIVYSDDPIKELKDHMKSTKNYNKGTGLYENEDHKAVIDKIFNKNGESHSDTSSDQSQIESEKVECNSNEEVSNV